MSTASAPPQPCPTQRALLRALWYFEIFKYPLTAAELKQYSQCDDLPPDEILGKLEMLVAEGQAFQFGPYFQSRNEPDWPARRRDFNRRADSYLPIARRMALLIGAFPYVRGVFVSGSLSKRCMPPDGDIDYFIITAPGRLWLARTMLTVFKKLFLFNSHKYFCINYFVDTEHLEIEEKNLFTATEIITLLPLYGREPYERFYRANRWAWDLFPNARPYPTADTPALSFPWFKKLLEHGFAYRLGRWLDRQCMRLTVGYWRRKFRHFDPATFDAALKSRSYVSKHHPLYFQKKVLDAFARRCAESQAGE
ncbi:MAG: hypothetical protein JNK89_07775 [Saprospiraceae bacterium]|nr:hypothetical protein [Saprospiraceae bacterium]